MDRSTLAANYASGDIYLHASITETYGNVAAEALASGLAFAGYDYAAAHELVRPGENGLLVPLGEEHTFIASAVRLATEPALVARLRANAAQAVQARSWASIVEQFEADLTEAALPPPAAGGDLKSEIPNLKSQTASLLP